MTAWETFLAMSQDDQVSTVLLAISPGIVSVVGVMVVMSAIRHLFLLSDKASFITAGILSAAIGGSLTFLAKGLINSLIGIELYTLHIVYAAVIVTPIANHLCFKGCTKVFKIVLYLVYQVSKALPEGHTYYWLAAPLQKTVCRIYYMLTSKEMLVKTINEQGEECVKTRIDL